MLNTISGILPVSAGRILFDGGDVTALPAGKRGVGLVFQELCTVPTYDGALEHLLSYGDAGIFRKESERARQLADMVHITFIHRKPAQLSGASSSA